MDQHGNMMMQENDEARMDAGKHGKPISKFLTS